MNFKREFYLKQLIDSMWNSQIKIITGLRRCGKSFLLFNIFKDYLLSIGVKEENIITLALDEKINKQYRNCDNLEKYLREKIKDKRKKYFIFLDEIQFAITKEEMEKHYAEPIELYGVLNELLHLENVDVYVTGSNSKLLSKDVMTEFRGRGYVINVYPLSFKEYFDYTGGHKADAFEKYMLYGGMPKVLDNKTDEQKKKYLSGLYNEIYFKDISERYGIELGDVMKELICLLSSSIGSLTNINNIVNTLKSVKNITVSDKEISSYIEYLEDAMLFNHARRYDVKGRKYFAYPIKYFCADTGLRNIALNFRQYDEPHIMENIVYNELLRRDFSVDVGVVKIEETDEKKVRHLKTCEIDFVVNKIMNKYYIQCSMDISEEQKRKQELRPLLAVKDFFKKIIITKSLQEPWIDEDGIIHIGIYDFLLNDKILNI